MTLSLDKISRTTAGRTALQYSLTFTLASFIFMIGFYFVHRYYIDEELRETLRVECVELKSNYAQQGQAGLLEAINTKESQARGMFRFYYLALDPDDRKLAGSLKSWPTGFAVNETVSNCWIDNTILPWLEKDDHSYWPGISFETDDNVRVFITHRTDFSEDLREEIAPALWFSFGFSILGAFILGSAISYKLLARVERVNDVARAVAQGDLTRRAPTDGSRDEFDELGQHFNDMLSNVEHLLKSVRRVTDNIAHDLRSPLSRSLNRLEVTLLGERTNEEYRDVLVKTNEDLQEIVGTFNALLKISQAEENVSILSESVDVEELVLKLAELYSPVWDNLEVVTESTPEVRGERALIFQALSNLLENAMKFSPPDSKIKLVAKCQQNQVRVSISDEGPGIPEDKRTFVLERFARLEDSRSIPGNGLGLSLVKAVATMHKAELELRDNNPGLIVTLSFST